MIRTLLFTVLLSACAVDPDVRDNDQGIDTRAEARFIVVSACTYCHAALTPFDERTFPRTSTPHTACAGDAACAAEHADVPASKLASALGRSCETCHAAAPR